MMQMLVQRENDIVEVMDIVEEAKIPYFGGLRIF